MNEFKNLNWIEAIKRTWYVIWGLLFVWSVIATIVNLQFSVDAVFLLLWGTLVPYLLTKAVSWVYRGLTSKKAS